MGDITDKLAAIMKRAEAQFPAPETDCRTEYPLSALREYSKDAYIRGGLDALTYTDQDVERVARAVAKSNKVDPDAPSGFTARRGWEHYTDDAIAAIEAFGVLRAGV